MSTIAQVHRPAKVVKSFEDISIKSPIIIIIIIIIIELYLPREGLGDVGTWHCIFQLEMGEHPKVRRKLNCLCHFAKTSIWILEK